MKRRSLFVLMLALLGAYLATGFYQVRPGQRAVVRRCGAVLPEPAGPGLHLGLPWGIDRVDRVAVDEQRELAVGYTEVGGPDDGKLPVGQLLTGDNNLLNLRLTVYYRVDPIHVVKFVLNQDRVDGLLRAVAEEAMVSAAAGRRIDPILMGQARDLEMALRSDLARRLASYPVGVTIEQVNLNFAQPPSDLIETFREVNRARTRREIMEREAMGLKSTEISLAKLNAESLRASGTAIARAKRTEATAQAERFLTLLRSLPTHAGERQQALFSLYVSKLQDVLSKMQIRVVNGDRVDQFIILPNSSRDR